MEIAFFRGVTPPSEANLAVQPLPQCGNSEGGAATDSPPTAGTPLAVHAPTDNRGAILDVEANALNIAALKKALEAADEANVLLNLRLTALEANTAAEAPMGGAVSLVAPVIWEIQDFEPIDDFSEDVFGKGGKKDHWHMRKMTKENRGLGQRRAS